jgi:hypothetical protein
MYIDDAIIRVEGTDGIQITERRNIDSVNFANRDLIPNAINHSKLQNQIMK